MIKPKYLYVAVPLLISLWLLCGCSEKKKKEGKTIITLSFFDEHKKWEGLTNNFTREYPEIEVKLFQFPANYMEKISTMFAGGVPPDVIFTPTVGQFADKGLLLDLTPYIKRDEAEIDISDIYPQVLENCKWRGKFYSMPQAAGVNVLFYNKDIFDNEKIPYPDENLTWDRCLEIAGKLTKDYNGDGIIDQYGIHVVPCPLHLPADFIFQNGGQIFDKEATECLVDSPETIEAIQFYVDLTKKHKVSIFPSELSGQYGVIDMMMTGKIAMFTCGWYACQDFKNARFGWDVAPLPRKKRRASFLGMNWMVISANTKHPEACWKLVKYISGKEGQRHFLEGGWDSPARRSSTQFILTLMDYPENRKTFIDAIEYGEPLPDIPKMGEIREVFKREMENSYYNNLPVEEACRRMAVQINKILKDK